MIHFLNSHDFPAVSGFATVPMILYCPVCTERHIDEEEFAEKPHHTHACQHCGHVWRPAILNTHGVQYLPGFKGKERPWTRPGVRELAAPPPEREKPRCTECGIEWFSTDGRCSVCRRDGMPQAGS